MNRNYPIRDNPTFKMHSSIMSKCHLNDPTISSYGIIVNFVFLIFEEVFFGRISNKSKCFRRILLSYNGKYELRSKLQQAAYILFVHYDRRILIF